MLALPRLRSTDRLNYPNCSHFLDNTGIISCILCLAGAASVDEEHKEEIRTDNRGRMFCRTLL